MVVRRNLSSSGMHSIAVLRLGGSTTRRRPMLRMSRMGQDVLDSATLSCGAHDASCSSANHPA
jgi:hypothetical protein